MVTASPLLSKNVGILLLTLPLPSLPERDWGTAVFCLWPLVVKGRLYSSFICIKNDHEKNQVGHFVSYQELGCGLAEHDFLSSTEFSFSTSLHYIEWTEWTLSHEQCHWQRHDGRQGTCIYLLLECLLSKSALLCDVLFYGISFSKVMCKKFLHFICL